MSHVLPKFRPASSLQPGWVEESTPTVGVSGYASSINAASIAEAAKPIGVAGLQTSSLYGVGG
jgi:hypothetical protein